MPGKRYKLRIIDGPWKGNDCRIIEAGTSPFPEGVNVEFRDGTRTPLPLRWLKQKPAEVHQRRNRKEKP